MRSIELIWARKEVAAVSFSRLLAEAVQTPLVSVVRMTLENWGRVGGFAERRHTLASEKGRVVTRQRDHINRWRHSGSVYQQMQRERKEQIVYNPTKKNVCTYSEGEKIFGARFNTISKQ